jgi:hypothetical protein
MAMPAMPGVKYTKPSGWQETQGGGMRVASFTVPGEGGQFAEIAVIPLPMAAGQETDIFNFWRSEVKLPAVAADELSRSLQFTEIGTQTGRLMDVVSPEPLVDGKFKMRMLVALLNTSGLRWNFRMAGTDELVTAQKSAFLEFLKSVSFEASAAPSTPATATTSSGQPAISAPADKAALAAAAKASGFSEWTVPDHWKPQPPGPMLLASFAIEDAAGKASLTVSSLARDGGGVLANVNRWRRQIGLGPIEEAALNQEAKPLDLPVGKALLADLTGQQRIIGAMLPHDGQTWYFKLMGDAAVAGKEKEAFLTFLKSLKFDHVH